MWLFDHPPTELMKERYGFEASPAWLEHLQKSAVKFGASASFVSAEGLLLTNHHVGRGHIQQLSTPQRDLLLDGFHAKSREQELKCPEAEARVLMRIADVTEQVTAAVPPGAAAAEAESARRKAILSIEQAASGKDKGEGRIVTLYGGARFHLYEYKRFTDVRLVFAPEQAIAFFGGDVDNFEFPRWDADFCLFRVYGDDGRPHRPENYLKLAKAGASEGELCLVAGHPGRTERGLTLDHVRHLRDVELPGRLRELWRREVRLGTFAGRDDEHRRLAAGAMFGAANSRKASQSKLAALQDPGFLAPKARAERELRAAIDAGTFDKASAAKWADAWDRVAAAQRTKAELDARGRAIGALLQRSDLAGHALAIVRLALELPKPPAERLREFGEADLPALYHRLYSAAPIYDAMETEDLASALSFAAETLGADDALVAAALAGKSPQARAAELVAGTKLADVAERKRLAEGGKPAVDASSDPLIRFATALDEPDRAHRRRREDEVEAVEREAYARIAEARFARFGQGQYPDATGTLRLAFGVAKGYRDDDAGGDVPAFTRAAGLYARAAARKGQPGFGLPQRWLDRRDKLDEKTPFNFALTADITGGNSGSPVVNRKGQLVGLIFDSNRQALANNLQYDERQGRSVAVDVRLILAALQHVYDAPELAREMAP